jgi:hypothetical protein
MPSLLRHFAHRRLAGESVRVGVGPRQERVVVEHLLEVRDQPAIIDRVTVKTAHQVVPHPAGRHPPEGVHGHLAGPGRTRAGVVSHQELERRGLGELGRLPEASVPGVVAPSQRLGGPLHRGGFRGASVLGHTRRGPHGVDQSCRGLAHLPRTIAIRRRGRLQHLAEGGHPVTRLRREVGASIERLALRREEDGQRPASGPGERLDRAHVDLVDVGPFLAIDLHVDVELVHQRRRGRVLEGLALHHVTPMAGRVPDREKDGHVLAAGPIAGFFAPRVPIDGVMGVLQEVRTDFARESVGHATEGAGNRLTAYPEGLPESRPRGAVASDGFRPEPLYPRLGAPIIRTMNGAPRGGPPPGNKDLCRCTRAWSGRRSSDPRRFSTTRPGAPAAPRAGTDVPLRRRANDDATPPAHRPLAGDARTLGPSSCAFLSRCGSRS